MKKYMKSVLLTVVLLILLGILTGCGGSSSSYQLRNKDGSLNMKYVNNLNNYFKKHPEKLPR